MPPLVPDSSDDDTDEIQTSAYINAFNDGLFDFTSEDEEHVNNGAVKGGMRGRRQNNFRAPRTLPYKDLERTPTRRLNSLESLENTPTGSESFCSVQDAFDVGNLEPRLETSRRRMSHICEPDGVYPKSRYEGYAPPLPMSTERDVINEFLEDIETQQSQIKTSDGEEFTEFELSEFSVYLPGNIALHKWEMRGLHNLATKSANSWYLFDGILSCGNIRRYVQCRPFKICSIGKYGQEFDTVGDEIWIQSASNYKTDIYYRLKAPSPEYKRYHRGFLWLADLAKHFVDFANDFADREEALSIHSFRSEFSFWLEKKHGGSLAYRDWYAQYASRDFRRAVATNIEFLWKEYIGTDPEPFDHSLWKQVKDMEFIPEQPLKEINTVVTPYVYDCFSHLKFGHHLKKVELGGEVANRRKSQGRALHLTLDHDLKDKAKESLEKHDINVSTLRKTARIKMHKRKLDLSSIAIGDVLGVIKDSRTSWKDEVSNWKTADECWWVLVQGVHKSGEGKREFDVIWLYKPSDTSCAKMRYPYHNELFLSDNCNCGDGRIIEEEVLCKAIVSWHGNPTDRSSDFFVRQTFLHDNSFVTMTEAHKQCFHLQKEEKSQFQEVVDKYHVGDTVLVVPPSNLKSKHGLEPVEIIDFIRQGSTGFISARRLLRRLDVDKSSGSRPNELVYTDQFLEVKPEHIVRKCLVRFYTEDELVSRNIPPPYNRDGTGNAFYIISQLLHANDVGGSYLQLIGNEIPETLIQGFDPTATVSRKRLRGLDLYCGGGNFGRGLEEGGAVQMTHAVDLAGNAIHTYYANQKDPESTKLFWGSVDDVLYEVMHNNPSNSDLIALPGMIDFLSAGSPCQGYSLLNASRGNETGLKNQSLVASVAAYVDIYRPKYALLENVIAMAQKGKGRDEDVLSQLICCLVGMGYQVQLFLLDAWSCGSPQSRSRLFVAMAAPSLKLPEHPGLSHSHPPGTKTRGLGQGANGLSFGQRRFEPTPFEFITASEATEDLPYIGDGKHDHCTRHPDHRITSGISQRMKDRIQLIPRYPREMCFVRTRKAGILSSSELQKFPLITRDGRLKESVKSNSRAWGRVHPQKLFPTIATSITPMDARTGRTLHWDQHRLLTVLEARRAQSFPDDEVLTGIPSKQWKIVGNSVARTVSLALGLSLREAWLANPVDDHQLKYKLTLQLGEMTKTGQITQIETTSRTDSFKKEQLATAVDNSMNEATSSDELYDLSFKIAGSRSSVSKDGLSLSEASTPSSEQTDGNEKKRHRADTVKLISRLTASKKAKIVYSGGPPNHSNI